MPSTRVHSSWPVLAVLALFGAGCGTGSDLTSTSQTGGAGTVHVVMKSLDFSPRSVQAKVGQRVTWTNEDEAPHNVTYVSGPKFTSSRRVLSLGKGFSIKLTAPGTIRYVCTLHSWMKATIVVSR
jgi:plastocyanin